ncbi:MAG: TetR/AcrR family transcriptional regulator [Rhodobiaceae bacterium]|nr:TetR/AcrR family transcriptional regulator [Rhodobiaceae bacterium]
MTYHHGNLRKELLDRAAAVIVDQGIDALSLRALARDLGVSHAAPSRHFKDKTALLAALATEGHRQMTEALNKAAEAAGVDPVARYNALGREVIHFSFRNPAYFKAMNHPEVVRNSDEALAQAQVTYMETTRKAAAAAQAAGWHPDEDLDTLVIFSSAAALGTANMLIDKNVYIPDTGKELEELAAKIIRLVVPSSAKEL